MKLTCHDYFCLDLMVVTLKIEATCLGRFKNFCNLNDKKLPKMKLSEFKMLSKPICDTNVSECYYSKYKFNIMIYFLFLNNDDHKIIIRQECYFPDKKRQI